jgi:xylan 1,4-beta-xylosidase
VARGLSATVLSAFLVLWASVGCGTAAESRIISADLSAEAGPMNTMFRRCIGAGRAGEGLRAEWRRQLVIAKDECGFESLRFHGLLSDDMGVFTIDAKGNIHHNWQYVDELFDFLLSINVRPFVEIGFMPSALASGPQTIFWWKGNITRPNSWERWEALITALLGHWQERYGKDETRKWHYEIWNEPNLSFFFAASKEELRQSEYFELYDRTARAVKAVDPQLPVGGPAGAGPVWIGDIIRHAKANGSPLDFISFHAYGLQGDASGLDEYGEKNTLLNRNLQAVADCIKAARNEIDGTEMRWLPIHITEWSASYAGRDPIHDSYFMPAYILDQIKKTGGAAKSMSYWVFTDIFEEGGPPYRPFHGGFGLMNIQGIRKPAFFAFSFLNRLGPDVLSNSDQQSWVTKTPQGGARVLFWDLRNPMSEGVSNHEYFSKPQPAAPISPAEVRLTGLAPGRYSMSLFRVGYRSNDAYSVYLADLDRPEKLTKAQVGQLNESASGNPEASETVTVGPDGKFTKSIPMNELDCVLLQLDPYSSSPTVMKTRHAFKMRIPLEQAAEYKRRHDKIWPLLIDEFKAVGVCDYSIFLDEQTGDLFATMKIEDARNLEQLASKDIMKKWLEMNKDIQMYEGDKPFVRPLKEMFHMD